MFPHGIELGTFCVLDRCDNHYTTETEMFNHNLCLKVNMLGAVQGPLL
jgi:hypothetical protein